MAKRNESLHVELNQGDSHIKSQLSSLLGSEPNKAREEVPIDFWVKHETM